MAVNSDGAPFGHIFEWRPSLNGILIDLIQKLERIIATSRVTVHIDENLRE
jgi:hypothetical protein